MLTIEESVVGTFLVRVYAVALERPDAAGWIGLWSIYTWPNTSADAPVQVGDTGITPSRDIAIAEAKVQVGAAVHALVKNVDSVAMKNVHEFEIGTFSVRVYANQLQLPNLTGWVGVWSIYARPHEPGALPLQIGDTGIESTEDVALAMAKAMASAAICELRDAIARL